MHALFVRRCVPLNPFIPFVLSSRSWMVYDWMWMSRPMRQQPRQGYLFCCFCLCICCFFFVGGCWCPHRCGLSHFQRVSTEWLLVTIAQHILGCCHVRRGQHFEWGLSFWMCFFFPSIGGLYHTTRFNRAADGQSPGHHRVISQDIRMCGKEIHIKGFASLV